MPLDFDFDTLSRTHFVVGVAGSVVGLRFAPGQTWPERAFNVLAGGLSAHYAAPGIAEWLRWTSPGSNSALAFGIGLFGLAIAAAVMEGIRATRLGEYFNNWLGSRNKQE